MFNDIETWSEHIFKQQLSIVISALKMLCFIKCFISLDRQTLWIPFFRFGFAIFIVQIWESKRDSDFQFDIVWRTFFSAAFACKIFRINIYSLFVLNSFVFRLVVFFRNEIHSANEIERIPIKKVENIRNNHQIHDELFAKWCQKFIHFHPLLRIGRTHIYH